MQKLLHSPQFGIYRSAVRRPARRLAQPPACLFQLSRLALQHSQQKERIRMARIHLQDFQVHRSRGSGATGAVVLRGYLHHGHQKLRNRDKGSGEGTGHCITSKAG